MDLIELYSTKFICKPCEKHRFKEKKRISKLQTIKSNIFYSLKKIITEIDYVMCNDIRRIHLCRRCYNDSCSNATGLHYTPRTKKVDPNDRAICPDFIYGISKKPICLSEII